MQIQLQKKKNKIQNYVMKRQFEKTLKQHVTIQHKYTQKNKNC